MTQEEKSLLLKDLCTRLSYGVHCRVFKLNGSTKEDDDILYGVIGDNVITLKSDKDECLMYYQIKPYLRPMSSMTDEEKEEWYKKSYVDYDCEFQPTPTIELEYCHLSIDWLNAHHFDFRNLIERGLAIDCTVLNVY